MRLHFLNLWCATVFHKCVMHSDTGVGLILALGSVSSCLGDFKVGVQFCFSSYLVKTLLLGTALPNRLILTFS